MLATELFDRLKSSGAAKSDSDVATILGMTPSRVSQLRARNSQLTPRQVESFLSRSEQRGRIEALSSAILPIVEMYEIEAVGSKGDAAWELLPTAQGHSRNAELRSYLQKAKGIYVFFDSMGRAVYVGKTEKQNLWAEMRNAFNRERADHKAFFVDHRRVGKTFTPAFEQSRLMRKQLIRLCDTAYFFSAYEVTGQLIPRLEAILVRCFANNLTNKRMENFPKSR